MVLTNGCTVTLDAAYEGTIELEVGSPGCGPAAVPQRAGISQVHDVISDAIPLSTASKETAVVAGAFRPVKP